MAKKKKVAKKKKAKKKARKKTTKKKGKKKVADPMRGLHWKKLEIMHSVPVMPCSAIRRDKHGLWFAHTQAEKVFYQYAKLCCQKHLAIRMIDVHMETLPVPNITPEIAERLKSKPMDIWPLTRAVCTFEILDMDTSQSEKFMGAGLGSNDVWSDTSAQTVAFKEALLLYFFTAWPQPASYHDLIREDLTNLDVKQFRQALKNILPPKEVMEQKLGATQELNDFWKNIVEGE